MENEIANLLNGYMHSATAWLIAITCTSLAWFFRRQIMRIDVLEANQQNNITRDEYNTAMRDIRCEIREYSTATNKRLDQIASLIVDRRLSRVSDE